MTSLDESEAISIVECKDVLNNYDLKISLSSIASNGGRGPPSVARGS